MVRRLGFNLMLAAGLAASAAACVSLAPTGGGSVSTSPVSSAVAAFQNAMKIGCSFVPLASVAAKIVGQGGDIAELAAEACLAVSASKMATLKRSTGVVTRGSYKGVPLQGTYVPVSWLAGPLRPG